MARITIEDCLLNVESNFELVLQAAKRARNLADGAEPMIDSQNDKPTVIALREIAEGKIGLDVEEVTTEQEPEQEAAPQSEGFI